jgi:lysophospholipase L1-like esterase
MIRRLVAAGCAAALLAVPTAPLVLLARAAVESVHVLFAGDSTTSGYGSTPGTNGYQLRFTERLNAAGVSYTLATPATQHGGTLEGLAAMLPGRVVAEHPDLVIIMIGLNDAAGGPAGVAGFESQYRALVQQLVDQNPTLRVAVVQAAYPNAAGWGRYMVDPVAVAAIHTWWWTVRTPSDRVVLVDATPLHYCRTFDGVHYRDDGYADLADLIYSGLAPTYGWPPVPATAYHRPPVRRPFYDRPELVTC